MLGMNQQSYGKEMGFADVYQPASSSSYSAAPQNYAVQVTGETPSSIAQAVWGNSALWYLISDANGLQGNVQLTKGQMLTLPTRANTVNSSYGTFKPYSAAEVIGDTTPTVMPPPPGKHGCGIIGQIIVVIVAVVVTYLTAGAAASYMGPVLSAAFGAAVGSVASQVVGMAIGTQDSFSWKAVGMAALGGAVTAGVGELAHGTALGASGTGAAVARAAISNALTQGIAVTTGLQDHFSWRGVAASAVASAVQQGVQGELNNSAFGKFIGRIGTETISNFAGGVSSSIVRGGKIELARIAADSFGNALASSVISSIQAASIPTKPAPSDIESEPTTFNDKAEGSKVNPSVSTDIAEKLKAKIGTLNIEYDKESGKLRAGVGDEVDDYLNSSKPLVKSIKDFTTTKIDGILGRVVLTDDPKQKTDFEPEKNRIFINIGDKGIEKTAEAFALTLAHEIGHYVFQSNSSLHPESITMYGNDRKLLGYSDYKRNIYDYTIRFGQRTEAAATMSEFSLSEAVKATLGVDIAEGRMGDHAADYAEAYSRYSKETRVSGKVKMLDAIGKQFGEWEHPNDPSTTTGGSSKTYRESWESNAAKSFAKDWYGPTGAYQTWQKELDTETAMLKNRTARAANLSGDALKLMNTQLEESNRKIAEYVKNRGPKKGG